MTSPLLTEHGAVLWRTAMLEGARQNLKADGHLRPVCFLIVRRDPMTREVMAKPGIIPIFTLDEFCEEVKAGYAQAIADLSLGLDAAGAVLIVEAWDVFGDAAQVQKAMAWRDRHGTLATYPGRSECVHITFEHIATGLEHWRGVITRDADGRPMLGEWEQRTGGVAEGRFAHLLSPTAYGTTGTEA